MAGAKQHNPGVRRTGRRKVGTAGTECEKNSGQSLIIPGSAIDGDNRAVEGNACERR